MQYFEIGEEVILCSVDCPEENGPTVILDVMAPSDCETFNRHKPGELLEPYALWSYWLLCSESHTSYSSGWFRQTALRKKPPPSTESFEGMMSNLTKVPETVQ